MSHALIDTIVGIVLFSVGMGWTVFRYAARDKVAFALIAILSPFIVVISAVRLLYLLIRMKRPQVGPCPEGLTEAERLVEEQRQRMFGGELREPTFARSWQRAYELELQLEASKIKRGVQKVLVHA